MAVRRDVVRNRARIVAAAAIVFRRHGVSASLDAVAAEAEVGRATLYRHFPDRGALLAAVLEERIEAVEQYAERHAGPDLLEHLVVDICWYMVDMGGLMDALNSSVVDAGRLGDVSRRSQVLLERALAEAVDGGRVRDDVTVPDILLMTAMLGGLVTCSAISAAEVTRAMTICFEGLRGRDASAPLPDPELRQ